MTGAPPEGPDPPLPERLVRLVIGVLLTIAALAGLTAAVLLT